MCWRLVFRTCLGGSSNTGLTALRDIEKVTRKVVIFWIGQASVVAAIALLHLFLRRKCCLALLAIRDN